MRTQRSATIEETHGVRACPEVALWRAVVTQAISDALELDRKAINWLLLDNSDARRVCQYADMEIDYIRPRLKAVVVLMAAAIKRGRVPRYRKGGVLWRPATEVEQERAAEFLDTPEAREAQRGCVVPASSEEQETLLARAIMASRSEKAEAWINTSTAKRTARS